MQLYKTLENILKNQPGLVTENGELKKWVIIGLAQKYDAGLITLLLEHPELKARFFFEVKNALIFNQSHFIEFIEEKNYLSDSYTAFRRKIGLQINGQYIKQNNDVALIWPFKDCILEGGQSREEDTRAEIFFNEILAQDEISQLLDLKVLTNARRYNKEGNIELDRFNRNAAGTITDNLVIKGNNLLALHSIKEEFAVK